jgi:hypothetical protein
MEDHPRSFFLIKKRFASLTSLSGYGIYRTGDGDIKSTKKEKNDETMDDCRIGFIFVFLGRLLRKKGIFTGRPLESHLDVPGG